MPIYSFEGPPTIDNAQEMLSQHDLILRFAQFGQ